MTVLGTGASRRSAARHGVEGSLVGLKFAASLGRGAWVRNKPHSWGLLSGRAAAGAERRR